MFVTLRLWPRRVFAMQSELPAIRSRFSAVGTGIAIANLTAAALGVLASELR